ncbi:MAG: hypothetical protein KA885_12280 [Spirochaetes bacterium]|nr:hypothetical protein [Spirochaetota bacterium]
MINNRDKLYNILIKFIQKKYDVRNFCRDIEILYFHDLNDDELNDVELEIFKELAEYVIYFSDNTDAIKKIPIYVNENQVRDFSEKIYNKLIKKKLIKIQKIA